MKKILIFIFVMFIMISSSVYAYSTGFEYMINSLGIPMQNTNGLWVNEEIYNEYNLIVYGNPILIKNKQRWKTTENGKLSDDGDIWNGEGVRGEYWILGENAVGKEVHNELFPDDYNSGISPVDWNYIEIIDAEESWLDIGAYHSDLQREYMQKQKLSRKGITYNLSVETLGISKARVENFATWKTAGSIYTENLREDGKRFAATFNIPPMAKDAEIRSKLQLDNGVNYSILNEATSIKIPISYGAIIENLSEYVTKDDIKNIRAELLIDGIRVGVINDNEVLNIDDVFFLDVNKNEYENKAMIEILVKCNVLAETYFGDDIPMYDSKEEVITIKLSEEKNMVEVKDINKRFESGDKPKIASIEIKRVSTDKNGLEKYVDLNIAQKTNKEFVCAGQVIYIRVKTLNYTSSVTLEIEGDASISTFDKLTEKFEWIEPKERKIKTRFKTLSALKSSYNMPIKLKLEKESSGGVRYFSTVYVIPYGTKQTLNSWAKIREETRNAFEIDEEKIFERIENPYSFVFKAKSEIGITTKRKDLDIFEAWNTIYNRDLSKYIK